MSTLWIADFSHTYCDVFTIITSSLRGCETARLSIRTGLWLNKWILLTLEDLLSLFFSDVFEIDPRRAEGASQQRWSLQRCISPTMHWSYAFGFSLGPNSNVHTPWLWGAFPLSRRGFRAVPLSNRQRHEDSLAHFLSPLYTLSVRLHSADFAWGNYKRFITTLKRVYQGNPGSVKKTVNMLVDINNK